MKEIFKLVEELLEYQKGLFHKRIRWLGCIHGWAGLLLQGNEPQTHT